MEQTQALTIALAVLLAVSLGTLVVLALTTGVVAPQATEAPFLQLAGLQAGF